MKAVILYDGVADGWSDKDVSAVMESVGRVADVLRGAGHSVQRVPVRPGLRWSASRLCGAQQCASAHAARLPCQDGS